MAALGLGGEVETRLILELDRLEPLELDRPRFGRPARYPDRALARNRRVIDPGDQVPGDLAPIAGGSHPGRPLPGRVAAVISRRVVGDAEAVERPGPAADPHLAADRHPGRLPGPGVPALAVRAHALDRMALVDLQLELDASRTHPNRTAAHDHVAAPPRVVPAGSLPEPVALAVPDPPEGHRRRTNTDDRGEDDQVVGEGAHPAPALAEPTTEQQRHRVRRHRERRAVLDGTAPRKARHLLLEPLSLQPRKRRISPAICSPRSSCRKWAAPSILTCSVAVGIQSRNRSPARGKGNTGSLSEKATSAGFSQPCRASASFRMATAPGSFSSVGTSSGNCAAPAFDSGVGKGAS